MAKIAAQLQASLALRRVTGATGEATGRLIASGEGWRVSDVLCTSGPRDRAFEERHSYVAIAVVAAGSFQYRTPTGRALMTPGSLFLGNPGQVFQCSHEYGEGDRCLSFQFEPGRFEELASDVSKDIRFFAGPRLPQLRSLSSVVARSLSGLSATAGDESWEELALELAASAILAERDLSAPRNAPRGGTRRVAKVIRRIEDDPGEALTLSSLAEEARLSPWHFLRTFQQLTGITPHQYLLRARLRTAAALLAESSQKIVDLSLESGFGDLSNFTRTFHAEFGLSPGAYRKQARAASLHRPS